jgi:hypothetical protein
MYKIILRRIVIGTVLSPNEGFFCYQAIATLRHCLFNWMLQVRRDHVGLYTDTILGHLAISSTRNRTSFNLKIKFLRRELRYYRISGFNEVETNCALVQY